MPIVAVVIYHSTCGEMGDETLVRYLEDQGGTLPTFAWDGEGLVGEFVSRKLRKEGLFTDRSEQFRSHGKCKLFGGDVHLVSVYAVREDVLTDPNRPGKCATLRELRDGKLNSMYRAILEDVAGDCKPARVV